MGLRTASVRHPHAEVVMAPALTEPNQTQTFKLPVDQQTASPVSSASTANGKSNGDLFTQATLTGTGKPRDSNGDDALAATTAEATPVLNGFAPASGGEIMSHCLDGASPTAEADDRMGLRKVSLDDMNDLLKADADVDQIFNNLPDEDADELMKAFKSIDGSGAELAADDPAAILDLFNVDVMSMDDTLNESSTSIKESQAKERLVDVVKKQANLERRLDALLRRLRKYQAYTMGQHVSGEVVGVYEHVHRTMWRPKPVPSTSNTNNVLVEELVPVNNVSEHPPPTPISCSSTKNLIKKLELSNTVLANNACRQKQAKYFASTDLATPFRSPAPATPGQVFMLPPWTASEKSELRNVFGQLESQMRFVQDEVDSDATVSSSGGDSCDEDDNFTNPHQQSLPVRKRAAWNYATARAAIASKWTWIQSQVADLEYKIRQHTELHRKVRQSKELVRLGGASPPHMSSPPHCLNGYRGQLPGSSPLRNGETSSCTSKPTTVEYQCARTRPLINFRKRKLLQVTGLHAVSKKAARPSTVRCTCTPPQTTCALCTGRTDPTYPRDHSEYISRNENLAFLDPAFHSVFSLNEDVSASVYMSGIMKTTEWQQRSCRTNLKSLKYNKADRSGDKSSMPSSTVTSDSDRPRNKNNEHRKKYNRMIKPGTATAIAAKIKNRHRGRKGSRCQSVNRSKKRARMSSAQSLGSDGADEEIEALGINSSGKFDSPSSSPLLTHTISGGIKRNRMTDSYDIDDIIIPYSVASSTRVERLQYKEILTPKWRLAERGIESGTSTSRPEKNNGSVKPSQENSGSSSSPVNEKEEEHEKDELEEDLSELAVAICHEKCAQDERKKFLSFLKLPIGYGRSRANRRTDSRAESSGGNTPDPMSPAPTPQVDAQPSTSSAASVLNDYSPLTSPPATPLPVDDANSMAMTSVVRRRTISQMRSIRERDDSHYTAYENEVPPYEKRIFPLSNEMYERMLNCMPDDHRLMTNTRARDYAKEEELPIAVRRNKDDEPAGDHDSESTESAYGDEDPNDPEWEGEGLRERPPR